MTRDRFALLIFALASTLLAPRAATAQAEAGVEAEPAAEVESALEAEPAAGRGVEGFLYGRVETENGNTYTGLLRWGDQEFFWDDLFNSTKRDLPYAGRSPGDRRYRDGRRVGLVERIFRDLFDDDDWEESRSFWVRFGDIDRIVPDGRGGEVVLKGGARFDVSGGGNDVDDEIRVYDASLGEVELEWRHVRSIQFLPTPSGVRPPGHRLYGRVETRAGTFRGFVQWDAEECISIDELDGESRDGDLSIEMGKIRSIARASRRSSTVVLTDGRSFDLDGTNDVDSSIRGIYVEDPRFGRVEISWDAFERVTFEPPPGSGAGYESYRPWGPLTGTVFARGGRRHQGQIVFDLDEEQGAELLNGEVDGVEYYVPFHRVASVTPLGRRSGSRVKLRGGEELELPEGQDVGSDNAGVAVLPRQGGEPVFVPWDEVERVEFDG